MGMGVIFMLWDVLGAAAVAALVILLVWTLRGLMLTPVRTGADTRIRVTLSVRGADAMLEGAVGALLWLDANGTLPCEIAIRDLGMDEETARVAEALAREGRVTIIREGN